MATVDYDKLSAKDKAKLAKEFSDKFNEAFLKEGTRETLAAQLVKQLRQIGSSALVDEVSNYFYNDHGSKYISKNKGTAGGAGLFEPTKNYPNPLNLRQVIIDEFSGPKEKQMLNALGYADDKLFGDKFSENKDTALLRSEDRDIQKSHFDLIGKDTKIPYLDESVKLGSGTPTPIKKFIKDTVESKKQPESAPAPENTPAPTKGLPQSVLNTMYGGKPPYQEGEENPFTGTKKAEDPQVGPTRALAETVESEAPQRGSRAFRKQSAEERKAQIEADDKKAAEMSSAIPNMVRSQLKLPRTRGTKKTSTATPSGGGASGGSGSDKAGLGYLRSREDMMARDKAAKEAMGKEALERRRTGEQRFATLRPEILAQQAERARLAEEKRQANEIKSGSGELLGRVIRDKSGKIIGTSTTKAGRRALGSGYKGATGTFDFSKPADSFAELDARDAVKGRMASRQQQVVDLMSGGPTKAQEKQIRPFDTGLAANTDNIGTPTPSEPSPLSPIPTNRGVAGGTFSASNNFSPTNRQVNFQDQRIEEGVAGGRPFDNKNVLRINRENAAVRNDPDTTMQETATAFQQKLAQSVDQGQRADNFLNQREVKKQQAIDAARLRDSVGATYQDSSAPVRQEPVDSKLPNATAEQIKKKLKELQANQ